MLFYFTLLSFSIDDLLKLIIVQHVFNLYSLIDIALGRPLISVRNIGKESIYIEMD